jgi:prepilin-type N-terminal cleavage/methylation domain-containing protein
LYSFFEYFIVQLLQKKGKYMKKTLGFTLAEILITIGIIGIIAAITIPQLINNYRKQTTVKKLKKTYTTLTQAIKMSEADNGSLSGWERKSNLTFWQTYLFPYLKVIDVKKFGQINPALSYTRIDGIKETTFTFFYNNATVVTLLDGSLLILDNESENLQTLKTIDFGIDINGTQKPNIIGIDFFVFSIIFDNDNEKYPKIVPFGAYGTSDAPFGEYTRENIISTTKGYNYNCRKPGRGQFCAALIMLDNWQIAKDYPFK